MKKKNLIPFIVLAFAFISTWHFAFILKKQTFDDFLPVIGIWLFAFYDFFVMFKRFAKNRYFKKLEKSVWWVENE